MYKKYIKRLLDIIISLFALIILSPVFLIVSILVLIFLGRPIIFKQKRPGRYEKIFTLYKFRTMTDKKDMEGNLLPNEYRKTKFGDLLRKTSLDEIPEFLNILKGDMSLIGPRPLHVDYLEHYSKKQKHRHDVRPGLTGWAQVNGRNSISWKEKFEYDVYYTKNITFILDMKIVFLTIKQVLFRDNIYSTDGEFVERFTGDN